MNLVPAREYLVFAVYEDYLNSQISKSIWFLSIMTGCVLFLLKDEAASSYWKVKKKIYIYIYIYFPIRRCWQPTRSSFSAWWLGRCI